MPRFDGPFMILKMNESASTVKLDLSPDSRSHPIFHTSPVLPYHKNNAELFPSHKFSMPELIINESGKQEYFVCDIINKKRSGHGYKYLVRWIGYGDEENRWLSQKELEDTEALDTWLARISSLSFNFLASR